MNDSIEAQADKLLDLRATKERKVEFPILTRYQIRYRARSEHVIEPTLLDELGQSDKFRDYGRGRKTKGVQ